MPDFCDNCGHAVLIALPVEPLYSTATAALLIPTTRAGLLKWASENRTKLQPALYRTWRRNRVRYWRASDIRTIRDALFSTARFPKKARHLLAALCEPIEPDGAPG